MKIGFVTSTAEKLQYYFPTPAEPDFIPTELPFTPDDQIAVNELRKQGHEVKPVIWDSPMEALHEYDLLIVRSTWDYMDNDQTQSQFLQWLANIDQAGIRIANPAKFMLWLLDKHYLQHLANEGIPVIPTEYYEKKSHLNLLQHFQRQGQFVVKPCISAAGKGLYHIKTAVDALTYQDEINEKLQLCSYMVQDFIGEVVTNGEWSLVFLGGKYSHALHKKPGPNSIMVHAERGGTLSFSEKPQQNIIDFAKQIYNKIFPTYEKAMKASCISSLLLYLRLDIIETDRGPLLIECEGVEPELFFRAHPKSETLFCESIIAALEPA